MTNVISLSSIKYNYISLSDVALCDAVVFTILRHLSLSSAALTLTASCIVIPVGGGPSFSFR